MTNPLITLRDTEEEGLRRAISLAPKGKGAPPSILALRAHFRSDPADKHRPLRFEFEKAHALLPGLPYRFSEALFRLHDADMAVISSLDVLNDVAACDQSHHLASRFRFWMAVSQMEAFFWDHPNHSHMSLNVSAEVAADPDFVRRMGKAMTALKETYPGKGIILEMLEHTPWHAMTGKKAQRCFNTLSDLGIIWAVDDYGALDGQHGPPSLRMAKKYTKNQPFIVKIDGKLIENALDSSDESARTHWMRTLHARLQHVGKHESNSLLVLEWIKTEAQIATIRHEMNARGLRDLAIHYVQGQHFKPQTLDTF